jgi:hypothetical protein
LSRLEDGHWLYDPKTRTWTRVGDTLKEHNIVEGELVVCARNGETLDFGQGPVHVGDSFEKARVMRAHGVMQHPGGNLHTNKLEPARLPTFSDYFHKTHGIPLSEASGLIHVREE